MTEKRYLKKGCSICKHLIIPAPYPSTQYGTPTECELKGKINVKNHCCDDFEISSFYLDFLKLHDGELKE